jgi:hypothetical protein
MDTDGVLTGFDCEQSRPACAGPRKGARRRQPR